MNVSLDMLLAPASPSRLERPQAAPADDRFGRSFDLARRDASRGEHATPPQERKGEADPDPDPVGQASHDDDRADDRGVTNDDAVPHQPSEGTDSTPSATSEEARVGPRGDRDGSSSRAGQAPTPTGERGANAEEAEGPTPEQEASGSPATTDADHAAPTASAGQAAVAPVAPQAMPRARGPQGIQAETTSTGAVGTDAGSAPTVALASASTPASPSRVNQAPASTESSGKPTASAAAFPPATPPEGKSSPHAKSAPAGEAADAPRASATRPAAGGGSAAFDATPASGHTTANASATPTVTPSPPPPSSGATLPDVGSPLPPSPTAGAEGDDGAARLNAARLGRGLASAVQQKGGGVTLRLTPPELGTVRIQLQLQGTSVTAQLHTQTEHARSMIARQIAHLRASLESRGLTVDRLSVQHAGPTSAANGPAAQQSQSQPGHQHPTHGQQQSSGDTAHDGRSQGRFDQQQQPQRDASGRRPDPQNASSGGSDFAQWMTEPQAQTDVSHPGA